MPKRYLLLLSLFASLLHSTTLTGSVKNPDGSNFTGTLFFTLNMPASLSNVGTCGGPAQIMAGNTTRIPVTSGALPSGQTIYGNDCLVPAGTYYVIKAVDANGNILFNANWQISGSTMDIGTVNTSPLSSVGGISIGYTPLVFSTSFLTQTTNNSGTLTCNSTTCPAGVYQVFSYMAMTTAGTVTGTLDLLFTWQDFAASGRAYSNGQGGCPADISTRALSYSSGSCLLYLDGVHSPTYTLSITSGTGAVYSAYLSMAKVSQ